MKNKNFYNEILNSKIDTKFKGLLNLKKIKIRDIPNKKWNILKQDIQFPILTINENKFNKNLISMKKYSDANNVYLAPHCKTSMSPQLLNKIEELGCWGFTAANNQQLMVLLQMGVKKIILANLITNESNLLNIFELLKKHKHVSELYVCVDSRFGVNLINKISKKYSFNKKIKVLIEIGITNSRSGIRNLSALKSLIKSIVKLPPNFILSGILFYEGAAKSNNYQITLKKVKKIIMFGITCINFLARNNLIRNDEYIISGGGSEFFDLVVFYIRKFNKFKKTRIIIRPGSYIAYGHGYYMSVLKKLDIRKKILIKNKIYKASELFSPSLELWAYIISQQDDGKAILNFGKRDVSYDLGLPIPLAIYRNSKLIKKIEKNNKIKIFKLNDQHAFIKFNKGFDIKVGDLLKFGVSHPCITLDNWNTLFMINSNYLIKEGIKTFF